MEMTTNYKKGGHHWYERWQGLISTTLKAQTEFGLCFCVII